MKLICIFLISLFSNFLFADIFVSNDFKNASVDIVDTYYFKINSKLFKRHNVTKLTYYSKSTLDYETSYIYESKDGLEKIYHDFNSSGSVVQRMVYEFPNENQLLQFLATGDMSFDSYLFVDMDAEFYEDCSLKRYSVIDGIVTLSVNGKDLIAQNFEISSLVNFDLNLPYTISYQ